ncbi:MAG: DNA endonuclease SmrA [Pseudomonadales bacterium]
MSERQSDRQSDRPPLPGAGSAADEADPEALFREAMSDVVPLNQKRIEPEPERQDLTPAQLERREAAEGRRPASGGEDPNYFTLGEVKLLHPRDTLAWKKDGVQHEVFKKLKAGRYPIDGQLDLHRHTVREARKALFDFLELARRKGWRTVLISHGRGERSPTPARIKSFVAHWLGQVPDLVALHSAARHQGGTGAVYVMLKKTPEARERARERHGLKSDR